MLGHLIEKFHEGETAAWFWRQVLIALAVRMWIEIKQHWPQVLYAFSGITLPLLFEKAIGEPTNLWLRWWIYPWPLSQIIFDFSLRFFSYCCHCLSSLLVW